MSLIDIEIQSQNDIGDWNNYKQMNFLLAKDDYVETRCGEIFLSHCKVLIFSCSECKDIFSSYEEFFNHLCEQHVSIDDDVKHKPVDKEEDKDLLDIEYYENLIVTDQEQADEIEVKTMLITNSPENALSKDGISNSQDGLSQDGLSQDYEISQYEDDLSQDILQYYEEIDEQDTSALDESADQNKTVTLFNDLSKFLEKDYRDIVDCEVQESDSTEYASKLQPSVDPFQLDSLVDDGRLECSRCDETFDSQLKLKAHTKTHAKDRRFKCHVCGFAFTEQFNLRSHIKRHNGTKPFECDQCEKKFITKNELKAHIRIHTGERPYICEICGNGFVTSGSLNEHRKRHNNYRPHKCTLCEKSFFDTGLLREHMVVHTGERTHFCDVCQSGFTRRKALLQHLKLHSGVKQYKCTYCDKAFAQKPGLASHIKTHRKGFDFEKSRGEFFS